MKSEVVYQCETFVIVKHTKVIAGRLDVWLRAEMVFPSGATATLNCPTIILNEVLKLDERTKSRID